MKNSAKILLVISILVAFLVPIAIQDFNPDLLLVAYGQEPSKGGPIVPCGRGDDKCDFNDLFKLVDNIIDFILFVLALPIAGLVIAIAGAQMVIYSSNDGKRKDSIAMIKTTIFGLVLALSAYVIVKAIIFGLANPTAGSGGDRLWDIFNSTYE